MIQNCLKMKDARTEFLVFGTRKNVDKYGIPPLKVGDFDIINNNNIKFLGVILDPHLISKDYITTNLK